MKCGCENPKGCECCGECGAQMDSKTRGKPKVAKRPAAKKTAKHR